MTGPIAVALARSGVSVPAGHRLVSLAEEPTLAEAMSDHNGTVWPEFLLAAPSPTRRLWQRLEDSFAEYQAMLIDRQGRIAAALNSAPFVWDGTIEGLPVGLTSSSDRSTTTIGAASRPPSAHSRSSWRPTSGASSSPASWSRR